MGLLPSVNAARFRGARLDGAFPPREQRPEALFAAAGACRMPPAGDAAVRGGRCDLIVAGYLGVLGWAPLGAVCAWVMWRERGVDTAVGRG